MWLLTGQLTRNLRRVSLSIIHLFRVTLRCRHNRHDGLSNHQPHHCSLNRFTEVIINKCWPSLLTHVCATNPQLRICKFSKNLFYDIGLFFTRVLHYCDDIMCAMAHQITGLTIVYSTVYSGTDQRKHQSSASLAFVRGIHRWPVNSPHKGPITQKMFPFHDVIMTDLH